MSIEQTSADNLLTPFTRNCGNCGASAAPSEPVYGMAGCFFFLCGQCWDDGVRFEEIMARYGWVPASQKERKEMPRDIPLAATMQGWVARDGSRVYLRVSWPKKTFFLRYDLGLGTLAHYTEEQFLDECTPQRVLALPLRPDSDFPLRVASYTKAEDGGERQ